jgi:hypothetical protein
MPSGHPRHLIFDSNGFSVRLTEEEYARFLVEERQFQDKWMLIEQHRRGLWAGNQDRYVKSIDDLNEWDTIPRVMLSRFLNSEPLPE